MIKKTRAELEQMSLKQLKTLDITNGDEEKMIQEIMPTFRRPTDAE